MVSATGNSSHEALKMNIETTAIAGSAKGTMSRVSTRKVRAPSSRNDSSYSLGIASKNPRRRKIVKGRFDATYKRTKPVSESKRCKAIHQQELWNE